MSQINALLQDPVNRGLSESLDKAGQKSKSVAVGSLTDIDWFYKDEKGSQQFFTWMSVDPKNGGIHIVFYDRRAHNDAHTDVYVASSFNGAKSWTNRLVSQSPFLPRGKVFFGDYNNISAIDGHVRPIWTREDNGKLTVWTALLELVK